jgi:hypothetical protein
VFFLVATVLARRHKLAVARVAGHHLLRTRDDRTTENAIDPIVIVLAVTVGLVIAYAALYRALSLDAPGAAFDGTGAPKTLDVLNAVYFSATTMATVGFGAIAPRLAGARLAVITQIGVGIIALSLFISQLVSAPPVRTYGERS